jgi:hypothetical protein
VYIEYENVYEKARNLDMDNIKENPHCFLHQVEQEAERYGNNIVTYQYTPVSGQRLQNKQRDEGRC